MVLKVPTWKEIRLVNKYKELGIEVYYGND